MTYPFIFKFPINVNALITLVSDGAVYIWQRLRARAPTSPVLLATRDTVPVDTLISMSPIATAHPPTIPPPPATNPLSDQIATYHLMEARAKAELITSVKDLAVILRDILEIQIQRSSAFQYAHEAASPPALGSTDPAPGPTDATDPGPGAGAGGANERAGQVTDNN